MAGLYAPLPTLRSHPRGGLRTDRGRRGLLLLHRSGLSPHTPCRSPGALTRVAARTLARPPIRDPLPEGFRHFVSSMPAPVASGGSGCRVGLAPTGKRRLVTAHTHSSRLLWLTEATLPISAGGSSKQEQRWRENGSEPQVEAASKRQEADPVRCECRAAAQQSPLRSRRWPRSAVLGLHGKRCCAPDHSRAKRRALRLHVQQGVPVPRR